MLKNEVQKSETLLYPEIGEVSKTVGIPRIVSDVVDGKIVQKVVFEETPLEKMNEGLSVNDFALENLLNAGYNLKRVDFDDASLNHIDQVLENLPPIVESNKN